MESLLIENMIKTKFLSFTIEALKAFNTTVSSHPFQACVVIPTKRVRGGYASEGINDAGLRY